jgi:uncharacterized protein (DUF362 family)
VREWAVARTLEIGSRAYVSSLRQRDTPSLAKGIGEAIDFLRVGGLIQPSTRVFLKPNLTYPHHKRGVTTSPTFIEATVAVLRDFTRQITVVESDGGSRAWTAEQAFEGHGIYETCRRYDVESANLTPLPRKTVSTRIGDREVAVELPVLLLEECDVFITLPVPKVHAMTGVSLALKNQWGCLPDTKRLRNHPQFPHKVLAINQLLGTRLALFDGTWFLDRTGPMDGDPVEMDLLIASDGPCAGSLVCCEIMGIDPEQVPHKRLARRLGLFPKDLSAIELNVAPSELPRRRFRLRRTFLNHLALGAFHSRWATWFVYESVFAKPVHELLYLVRGRPKDVLPYS